MVHISQLFLLLTSALYLNLITFGAEIVDRCSAFSTWNRSELRNNCTSFSGCLTQDDRKTYLNSVSSTIPCGFMMPGDLDVVQAYFSNDHRCRIVVFTTIFYAYDKIFNPDNMEALAEDVCFVLIIDRMTLREGSQLLSQITLRENSPWMVFYLRNPPDPNPGKAVKMVKLAGPTLFPNAEWVIYVDAKGKMRSVPYELLDRIDSEVAKNVEVNTIHLGISKNPFPTNTPLIEARKTIDRLKSIYEEGKDDHFEAKWLIWEHKCSSMRMKGFIREQELKKVW